MSICYIYVISKKVKIEIGFDINFILKLFHYGIRGFFGSLLLILIFKIDYYILNMFSNIRDVGLYSVSVGFGEMIFFIPEAIGVMLFPKLASMDYMDRNKRMVQLLRFFFLMLGIITLFVFLLSRQIMVFVYGIQYAYSAHLMRIMLPGFFFLSFYYLYFSYFYSRGKPEVVTAVLFITAVIKIILSLILIPKFGAQGASFGTLISYIICGFIFVLTFLKYSGENLKSAFLITNLDIRYILSHIPTKKLKNQNTPDAIRIGG
jgi:O-antigen/teichoic acid export membrane protein